MEEEHEQRYQRLFLPANLKNELYFLKSAENIEGIMTGPGQLYEQLGAEDYPEPCVSLPCPSPGRARGKKGQSQYYLGIEGEVADAYNDETMRMSDLLHILRDTMRHILGERQNDAAECRCERRICHCGALSPAYVGTKNLVMNAAEAIQSGRGSGMILVEERVVREQMVLTVRDTGPGISKRAMQNLFQVGYSTKFDPQTETSTGA